MHHIVVLEAQPRSSSYARGASYAVGQDPAGESLSSPGNSQPARGLQKNAKPLTTGIQQTGSCTSWFRDFLWMQSDTPGI